MTERDLLRYLHQRVVVTGRIYGVAYRQEGELSAVLPADASCSPSFCLWRGKVQRAVEWRKATDADMEYAPDCNGPVKVAAHHARLEREGRIMWRGDWWHVPIYGEVDDFFTAPVWSVESVTLADAKG